MRPALAEEPLTPETVVAGGRRILGDYVRLAAAGDVDAFMVFYDATCDDAYRLALCLGLDTQAAAVALVHTYISACRAAHTFDPSGQSPRAWVLSILQSEVKALRGASRQSGTRCDVRR